MNNNMIEYPITVSEIEFETQEPVSSKGWNAKAVGKFVSIRPVSSVDPDEKTYLGLYLGDIPVRMTAQYDEDTKVLKLHSGVGNPAIFVFDLNRVVMGYESWWGIIENEDDLAQVTDKDIENIWYVKALKAMHKETEEVAV